MKQQTKPTINFTNNVFFTVTSIVACTVAGMLCSSQDVLARTSPPGPWNLSTSLYTSNVSYEDSPTRDTFKGSGITMLADYHDSSGIKLGYQQNTISFLPSSGFSDIDEKFSVFGGKYHIYTDRSRYSFFLDLYHLEDEGDFIDEINVGNLTVSYTDISRSIRMDLTYSESDYQADNQVVDDMNVTQLTTTFGMSLNNKYDWIQLKGFFITPEQSNRFVRNEKMTSVQTSWTHWFDANIIQLSMITISVLGGERIFAVDSSIDTVYNLADLQTGAVSLSAKWNLGTTSHLLLSAGKSEYEDLQGNTEYSSRYLYLNVTRNW